MIMANSHRMDSLNASLRGRARHQMTNMKFMKMYSDNFHTIFISPKNDRNYVL